MPKSSVSSDALRRKLSSVTNTMASITSLRDWFLNNRKNSESFVNAWVAQVAKSDHEHRLTLLFVANDVVQHCRKKAPEMKDTWRNAMGSAFSHLTHHSIRSGVEKVLSVWETRQVFDKELVSQLRHIITTAKNNHKDKAERALKDFKPTDLVEALKEYSNCENDLRLKRELLSSSGLDESDPEKLLDKVKERGQGQRARQELEQWTQLLIEYVDLQETAIERRRKLLSLLDQSCIFYQAQFHEVNVVLKAYKDYQERVLSQKRRCQEMMKSRFPENFPNISPMPSQENSPVPSPVQDMQMSEPESSSDEEPMPTSLASFFAPAEIGESSKLPKGSIEADGDLDSRLANILNSSAPATSSTTTLTNSIAKGNEKPRKSRWDSEGTKNENGNGTGNGDNIPPPPMPPTDEWAPPPPNNWIPPNQPSGWEPNGGGSGQFGMRGPPSGPPPPPRPHFPPHGGPPGHFGGHDGHFQNSFNSPIQNRFDRDFGNRGNRGNRGRPPFGGPRTPQGQRPPRQTFHSEGGNFRGRGNHRGNHRGHNAGFTPRGPRGGMRGRFPNR